MLCDFEIDVFEQYVICNRQLTSAAIKKNHRAAIHWGDAAYVLVCICVVLYSYVCDLQ